MEEDGENSTANFNMDKVVLLWMLFVVVPDSEDKPNLSCQW